MSLLNLNPILEGRTPPWVRCLLVFLIALVPTAYMAKQYETRHDLTQMILFGQFFAPCELPEVRQLQPAHDSPAGYDGQFYAQMAIDPTLQRPDLKAAIDDPEFREQRIFMPTLAFLLGGGRPASILFAYALLNLIFWYVLLGALLVWMRAHTVRDFLTLFAVMLTSGALVSMQRALTDLPAATLGTLALMAGEIYSVFLIAAAILTKPTSGLFLLRYAVWPWPGNLAGWFRRGGLVFLALVAPALWILYLHHLFGSRHSPPVWPFDLPLRGLFERGLIFWHAVLQAPLNFKLYDMTGGEWTLFQFLTLVCLALEAIYLLARPHVKEVFWIVGAGFAVMFLCLSSGELVEELNFDRTVLALTICFNLVLWRHGRGWSYALPFVLGNFGLVLHLHDMLVFTKLGQPAVNWVSGLF